MTWAFVAVGLTCAAGGALLGLVLEIAWLRLACGEADVIARAHAAGCTRCKLARLCRGPQ